MAWNPLRARKDKSEAPAFRVHTVAANLSTSDVAPLRVLTAPAEPVLNLEPEAQPAEQRVIATVTNFDDLPVAVRMFGDGKTESALAKDHRTQLGALIHEDGSATILLTVDAKRTAHLTRAFRNDVASTHKVRGEQVVSVAVLTTAYDRYAERKAATQLTVQVRGKNTALQFASDIITDAMKVGASDIHLEIRNSEAENTATVKFRVDGDIRVIQQHVNPAEVDLAKRMIATLFQGDSADEKSRSNSNSSGDTPQHALVRRRDLNNVSLRYQTIPDKDGYDLVMRLLTYDGKEQDLLSLPVMGFEADQEQILLRATTQPFGASFMGGSTGAGKTTTLAGVMAADPLKKTRKRYSAEDPVELDMPDVTQTPVQRAGNDLSADPFIEVLKAFMRGDPGLLIVGEIREKATASLMTQLALTGHNVWATLHINRMFDALIRLTDESIGVPKSILGSNTLLNMLSSQSLMKKVCSCKVPFADAAKRGMVSAELVEQYQVLSIPLDGLMVANRSTESNRNDCPICNGTGEKGRTVCAEMTLVDDEMKDLISVGQFGEVEKLYRKRRRAPLHVPDMEGKTMLDHALLKASRGEICMERAVELAGGSLKAEIASRRFRGYLNV